MVTKLRAAAPTVIQLLALAAVVAGIAMIYVPAALIVGGALVVVAIERQPKPQPPVDPRSERLA